MQCFWLTVDLHREYAEADASYQSAIRALRDVDDKLWLAGVCCCCSSTFEHVQALEGSGVCQVLAIQAKEAKFELEMIDEPFGKFFEV